MKITGATIEQIDKRRKNGAKRPRSECRKWRLWVTTDSGRRSKRFTGTYTEASNALESFKNELRDTMPDSESFASYALAWGSYRKKSGNFSPNTIDKDKRNINALLLTDLSKASLNEITPDDCRKALVWLKENPQGNVETLSNTTIRTFHTALNSILNQAEFDGKIKANPMRKVKAPKDDTKERKAITPIELNAVLDELDGTPIDSHVMAVYLILCLGLRRSEALALLDSDLRDGLAYVHQSVKEAKGTIAAPKSRAGVRTLPMPPRLVEKVDEWREIRTALGLGDAPTLCCNANGGVMRPQNFYKWWVANRDSFGCAGLGLHELRHSNLSMMARFMSPFDLKNYAGWSSIEPARIYIHDDLESVKRGVSDAWLSVSRTKNAPTA